MEMKSGLMIWRQRFEHGWARAVTAAAITAIVVAIFIGTGVIARGQGGAAFPKPAEVAKDYPDEVQQYVILNLLWDVSKAANPGAKAERSAYYNASEAIRQKYMVAGTAPYAAFDDKMRHLSADRDFKRQVLEKYHLANLPPAAAPQVQNTAAPQQRTNTDVTDAMIKGAVLKAAPALIATLILMVLVSGVLVRMSSRLSVAAPPSVAKPAGAPDLPQELRVVKLPLLEYSVELISAVALEKEVTMETHGYTSTTAGQVYSVGNQIHSTPGQTTTTISTTQKDLIWVRTAAGRETSWTFTGGDFKVRPGHVISAIAWSESSGKSEFLMSFNHTTGQFMEFKGVPYGTKGAKAWWASTLIGSIGFGIAIAIILSIQPEPVMNPVDRLVRPMADWIMGGIPSVILSFIIVGRAQRKIRQARNSVYRQKYAPGFRQFLEQSTPALERFFGTAPAAPVAKA